MPDSGTSRKIFIIANMSLLVLFSTIILFPYINILALSLNDGNGPIMKGLSLWPRTFSLDNFKTLVTDKIILNAGLITILRVASGTLLTMMVEFLAAYALTKKFLRGRRALTLFLMIPMFVSGGIVPYYLVLSKLVLLNKFWVYIITSAFGFYDIVIIRTYLYTIPESLQESAKLDGANELRILWKIILPLSAPIVATMALYQAVYHWNDWTTTLYFVTNSRLFTLQYVLRQILSESDRLARMIEEAAKRGMRVQTSSSSESLKAAQIILTTIPIVILYPFLQKYFIKGLVIGGVKE